jgi:hypothetical protein
MSEIAIERYGWRCPLCKLHIEQCKHRSFDLREHICIQADRIKELERICETQHEQAKLDEVMETANELLVELNDVTLPLGAEQLVNQLDQLLQEVDIALNQEKNERTTDERLSAFEQLLDEFEQQCLNNGYKWAAKRIKELGAKLEAAFEEGFECAIGTRLTYTKAWATSKTKQALQQDKNDE